MAKKALEHVAARPWAILPSDLEVIAAIADRDFSDMEAVEKIKADRLANAERAGIRDGVAIIDVMGPLFRYANIFTDISGATSFDQLGRDLAVAEADPDVTSILLNIDSPGGMVNGTNEFAEAVRATEKPVTAYVGYLAASAAYWIAAAADEIVLDKTAQVGSIGVVMGWTDDSAAMEKAGLKDVEFVSSQSPNKRPDHRTDDGRAEIQRQVDDLADIFVATVAKNRGVSTDTVINDFGRGGLLVGEKAIAVGMADRLGNFEEVLAGLAGDDRGGHRSGASAHSMVSEENLNMTDKTTDKKNDSAPSPEAAADNPVQITADLIASDHADIADHFKALGAEAERKRILDIEAVALPGHDKLVAEMKADGSVTAGDAAQRILAAEQQKLKNANAAIQKSGKETEELDSSASEQGAGADDGLPTGATVEERAQAAWDKDADIRAEHPSLASYTAFLKAKENGQIRGERN